MKLLYLLPILLISTIIPVYAQIDSILLTGDVINDGFYTSLDLFFEDGVFDDGDFTIVDMTTWDINSFPIKVISIDNAGNIIFTSNLDGNRFLNGEITFLDNDKIIADVTIFTSDNNHYNFEYVIYSFN